MKKTLSLFLVLTLICALSLTAFAAEGKFTISVPDDDTHTYFVYQIFTGDLHEGVLSNVKWGANAKNEVNPITPGTAVDSTILNDLAGVANSTSDSAKLAVILKYVNLNSTAVTVDKDTSYDADPGYYLIKDSASLDGKDDASTTYIVKIVNDVVIARKAAKPTVEKKVYDNVDTNNEADWYDTADHAINESFQFKLEATLEADTDYAAYPSYKVVFNDSMSDGVTFESIDSVKINTTEITSENYSCTATAGQNGGKWTLTIDNIKDKGIDISTTKATITVIYNAHLNADAFVNKASGTTNNMNEVYLTYSNNPNASGEMGKTTTDTVWVFTYGVDNFKYELEGEDATKKPLPGAGFTLYNGTEIVKLVWNADKSAYVVTPGAAQEGEKPFEMTSQSNGYFNIIGLDDGTYTLKETTTPAGYNTAADTTVIISATHPVTVETAPSVTLSETSKTSYEIENKSGTVLPETGGIGTTIFYIVGTILILGAVILLITKKRMSEEN